MICMRCFIRRSLIESMRARGGGFLSLGTNFARMRNLDEFFAIVAHKKRSVHAST